MNKKEVSELLGVSTRLVEKYASEGRLGQVKYVRGKTGKQADYDPEAVRNLKAALESPDTALAPKTPDARLFAGQLIEVLRTLEKPRIEAVRVTEKLLLNLDDCRLLTGLSREVLYDAIRSGSLKARVIGRGYKVKRQDLDDFVNSL